MKTRPIRESRMGRGEEQVDGARDPPPYMPDAIAVPREGSVSAGIGTSLEAYGKDQNYLGLRC
jgi:hypothetical protein